MGLFSGRGRDEDDEAVYSEDEVKAIVKKELAKQKALSEGGTGDKYADAILEGLSEVSEDLKKLGNREKGKGGRKGGGMFGDGDFTDMIMFFNRLNMDQAARYGIERCTFLNKGPTGSDGLPIGGPGYDPINNIGNNNIRITKWTVNGVVFLSRALAAFFLFTTTLIKWEILDVLLGSGDTSGFEFEDLMMFQMLASGFGASSSSTSSNPLDFLTGLFSTGGAVLDTQGFYPIV